MFQTTPSQRNNVFKGLRLKSPQGKDHGTEQHPDQIQRTSPLRLSSIGKQYPDAQSFSEFKPVESQTAFLKREIQVKEAALERITDDKDRLRIRINNTLGLNSSKSGNYRQNNLASSISQTSIYSKDLYQTNQMQRRDITPPSQEYNRKSSSPLRHQQPRLTLTNNYPTESYQSLQQQSSNKGDISIAAFKSTQKVSNPIIKANIMLQSDSLHALQQDNSQLQRRLNLVVAELDRMNRDKHAQQQHLGALSDETDYYMKAVEDVQKPDRNSDILHEEMFVSRENNKKVQSDILKIDQARQDAINQLRLYQAERERRVQNCEDLSSGLQSKLTIMKNIEQEISVCQEQFDRVNRKLQTLNLKITDDERSNQDIQTIITRLQRERDDLHLKMSQLSENYNNAVAELSRERKSLQANNKRHMQLLSSKVIFLRLVQMTFDRKQCALNEIITYCKFDNNCHRALNQFSQVLKSCGHYQMRIGLQRWFQNALKPLTTRNQGSQLAKDLYNLKLKSRSFRQWINKKKNALNEQGSIGKAASFIFEFIQKSFSQERKIAFQKWRETLKLAQQRGQRLSIVIGRKQSRDERQCFQKWHNQTICINEYIRQHVLANVFAAKQLMLIAYRKFHSNTQSRKDSRISKLSHILKAWRDSVAYRKYMMAQNVAASRLRKNLNQKLLMSCLYSIRHFKEQQKFEVVEVNLQSVFQPAIEKLTYQIQDEADQNLRLRKLWALTCIANRTFKSIQSYFSQWKNVNNMTETKIATNLKQLITSLYRKKIHRAFNLWNRQSKFMAINIQEDRVIANLVKDKTELNQVIRSLKIEINDEDQRIDLSQHQRLRRSCEIYKRRMLNHFMRRWSQKVDLTNQHETQAGFVMQKLRQILCRQAFAIFTLKVKMCRQADLDESRADYYIQTLKHRRLRQILNAFCQYHASYTKQKKNIGIALSNIDISLQRKAFFKWCDKGNLKQMNLLADAQNNETMSFDTLNKTLGNVTGLHSDVVMVNQQLKSNLMLQGQRVLANTFQRYYYIKAQRGIEQWVKVVSYQKHLEGILKRQIQHMEKSMFYQMKAAFQNWIAQSKITETKAEIVYTQFAIADTVQQTKFNRETHESATCELTNQTQITVDKTARNTVKVNVSVQRIIEKNDKCHFQSQLRHIFNTWSAFAKSHKRFLLAIERVISKSIYQQGFSNINAFSQDKKLTRHQNNSLKQMRRMFWRKNCERAIALWNTKCHKKLTTQIILTEENKQLQIDHFEHKVESIKQWSCTQGNAAFQNQQKQKALLTQWRETIQSEKKIKFGKLKAEEISRTHKIRNALKKWAARRAQTIKMRNFVQKQTLVIQLQQKQAVFNQMARHFRNTKSFAIVLNNVATKFDNLLKQSAFQMMQHFSDSRLECNKQDKLVSVTNIQSCLNQMYLRRMTSNLSFLKSMTLVQKRRNAKVGNMLGHWHSRNKREAFLRWKDQAHYAATVQEVNETGPVVEEVLEFQIQHKTLTSFMESQAYTSHEIQDAIQISQNAANELLAKSVSRLQHYTQRDNLYLKPKMFDRWKAYVKMRKLLRYILRNIENKLKPVNADMSIAFNRWKFAKGAIMLIQQNKQQTLNGEQREKLTLRSANNHQRLKELNQLVDQGETFMGHMGIQRDELVDSYIKSQRLAFALGRDNLERGMRRALNQIDTNAHLSKRRDLEMLLDRNINLIASLKERIQDFESDNLAVADENEELRQFSLDGYQIAKNVQSLSHEREKLSVDLADKASIIKRLLRENEQLQGNLRQAQDHAAVLVQQSQSTMRRMQQQRPLVNN